MYIILSKIFFCQPSKKNIFLSWLIDKLDVAMFFHVTISSLCNAICSFFVQQRANFLRIKFEERIPTNFLFSIGLIYMIFYEPWGIEKSFFIPCSDGA